MKKLYKSVIKKGSIYSLGSLLENALAFIFLPLYTVYLNAEEFGIVALITVTISIVLIIIEAPENAGIVRHYYDPLYETKRKVLVFNLIIISVLKTIIIMVILIIALRHISFLLLDSINYVDVLLIYSLSISFRVVNNFGMLFLRLQQRAKMYITFSIIKFAVNCGLVLILLIVYNLGIYALAWGTFIGAVAMTIPVLPTIFRNIEFKFNKTVTVPVLKYGYPLIVSSFSNFLIQLGDRYILKLFGTVQDVGIYSFGYKISRVMDIAFVTPAKQIIEPSIFKLEKNINKLKKFVYNTTTYLYMILFTFGLGLIYFSKEIIEIVAQKQEFYSSWVIVPFIVLSYIQHGIGLYLGKGIVMAKKPIYNSIFTLIAAIINIALNILFIPMWGIIGAALATLISYVVWNILKLIYSIKLYDMKFDLKRLGLITITGILFCAAGLVSNLLNVMVMTIVIKIVLIIIFPVLIYSILTENEKQFFRDMLLRFKRKKVK
ncbi:MAG: polysaccharide biosynthesis protein [Spirochaetales bacterium]|nr:polysaccharide biosynthesis protein [Spirochaetales bacterium]